MDDDIWKLLNRELGGAVLSSLLLSWILKYGLRTPGYYFSKSNLAVLEVIVSDFIENATLTANNCIIWHFILYGKELFHWTNVFFSMVIYFLFFSVWMTLELI